MSKTVQEHDDHYLIGQYKICKHGGRIHDDSPGDDGIPFFIFELRDYLSDAKEEKIKKAMDKLKKELQEVYDEQETEEFKKDWENRQ